MCGRLVIYSPVHDFAEYFGLETDMVYEASYNVAPTSEILACRLDSENQRELITLRWGLVPHWSKGIDHRYTMINARAETVHSKPAYRQAFKQQRCLIPVNGFYEWKRQNGKQPYYFHKSTNKPIVFAGLWEHWSGPDESEIHSCAIIVTEANELMCPIHDRMPVILNEDKFDAWLHNDDGQDLQSMLIPYQGTDLKTYQVSSTVNSTKNNNPDLINKLA